jgi:hypothetical protein
MIMDRAPGAPLLSGLGGMRMLTSAPRLARQIPEVLASSMVELHAVDPTAVRSQLDAVTGVARTVPELVDGLRNGAKERGRLRTTSRSRHSWSASPRRKDRRRSNG